MVSDAGIVFYNQDGEWLTIINIVNSEVVGGMVVEAARRGYTMRFVSDVQRSRSAMMRFERAPNEERMDFINKAY